METTMTIAEFVKAARSGKTFSCTFGKRETGEVRKMLARTGVHKYVKGVGSYDALSKNLLRVWDLQKQGYRHINLDWPISAKLGGRTWNWNEDRKLFIAED